jgi:hexosaminidase
MLVSLSLATFAAAAAVTGHVKAATDSPLLPTPRHFEAAEGFFAGNPTIRFAGAVSEDDQAWLHKAAKKFVGVEGPEKGELVFKIDPSVVGGEAYKLRVTPNAVEADASTAKGLFWALQTLRQLQTPNGYQCATIEDAPRFGWRGVLLDEGRHFMGAKFVKHLLDVMSIYKFNVLHWHLTEDQGWRIEIKSHPELTKIGAWRTESDGTNYGGFYTQQQIKDIVLYAEKRNITIVPEIEMPGHASAAIASIPDLGCSKQQIKVPTTWGVFEDVYCAGRESTFTFLDDVLSEVVQLFPSKYIHIGGDEVPKARWHDCPDCQARMKSEGLKDEHELQSYFIRRIQKILHEKGKELIGWDEIMEGGLAKGAVVQIWRDQEQVKEAIASGNQVILSPDASLYLNHPANDLPMKQVYAYDPLEGVANPALVKGIETTLWSERITSTNCLAMLLPRGLAVSEIGWSSHAPDFNTFLDRVHRHLAFMKAHGIDYGPEDQKIVTYKTETDVQKDLCVVHPTLGMPGLELRYTTDGTTPTASSPSAVDKIEWSAGDTLTVAPYRDGDMLADPTVFQTLRHLALGAKVTFITPPSPPYNGSGPESLVDGFLGSSDFHDGMWLGWTGADFGAIVDLGSPVGIEEIALHCMQQMPSWILMPTSVNYEISNDGQNWTPFGQVANTVKDTETRQVFDWFTARSAQAVTTRYIRVTAKNYGKLPAWHLSAGKNAFIFIDELAVR